jgi:hypothetical protein
MRRYHSTKGYRLAEGGAIELEGQWAGIRWMALALLPVLLVGFRSPLLVGVVAAFAVYLYVFPARRRVVFDPSRACLVIEHAGLFAERGARRIPFAELTGLVFEETARRGGRAQHALYARTARGRVYLLDQAGGREAEDLAERLNALVG